MGLKGNLAAVNLADVFQLLSRGKSSGLLRVQAPEGTRFIELQDGFISLAGRATQYIQLGDLLLSRKAITDENLSTAMKIHKENGMVLGQVLIEMNYVQRVDLDESLRFLIEEEVCDLFTLREGEFDFLQSASLDTKVAPGGGAVRLRIDPDSLLLEAARRADEWKELEQRITSQSLLFRLTEEGMRVYQDADGISDEGRTIMRLLQAKHSVEGIVQKSCLGRLNSNRMILELWDAQLIEAVARSEYLDYANALMETGQISDAHRVAVHASKVGSPETIKLAIALIDTLRKQLVFEDKPVVAQIAASERRASPSVLIKKPTLSASLIIKKKKLPWAKIALITSLILAAGGYFAYYTLTTIDPNEAPRKTLEKLKVTAKQMVYSRHFADALEIAGKFGAPNPDWKKQHEKIQGDIQIEVEEQFTRDFKELLRGEAQNTFSNAQVAEFKQRFKDYDGVVFVSKPTIKDYKKIKKLLPELEEKIKLAEWREKLDQLTRNAQLLSQEKLVERYRILLAEDPFEAVAKDARAELYKLLAPRHEAERELTLAHEMLANGGYEQARKLCEAIKTHFPSTKLAEDADKTLESAVANENKANDSLAKIRKLILQRNTDEARRLATQLLSTKPPAEVQAAVVSEIRKLQTDIPEDELRRKLVIAAQSWDIDAKLARTRTLDVVNAYPFSEAASNALLRVKVTSFPEGAFVIYKERSVGKTPLTLDLPVMGPVSLTFSLPGFESFELIENNFRGESIQAVFIRKPQASVLAPVTPTAGMLAFKDLVLVAGGSELTVLNARTLDVLRRVNLESTPQPMKIGDKIEQPAALAYKELKLRGMSATEEDAEGWAFVSCSGSYFFQIPSNGTDFYRIACQPGSIGAPQMYRPKKAAGFKLISVATKSNIEIYNAERQLIPPLHEIPSGGGQDQPIGLAFDGDTYYVPRDNNVVCAVEGYRGDIKWKKSFDERLSLPLAVNADLKMVAVADVKGHVSLLDSDLFGKDKGHTDLGAATLLGLTAAANGFVAALDDNSLAWVPSTGGPSPWITPLPGRVIFTPLVRNPDRKDKKGISAAIVCCETLNNAYIAVAVSLKDGSIFWRGRLTAKPVAGSVSAEAVYIGTVENELVKFDFTLPTTN